MRSDDPYSIRLTASFVTLFGIFYYLMLQGYLWGSIITIHCADRFADGELRAVPVRGLGLECKVGFMQRPERVVLTASVPCSAVSLVIVLYSTRC